MEWVETTGKTVEDALQAALEQLGVDVADADYDVVEEAKTGLFGRLRTEARVRARVRPTTPRPKEERRNRGRKDSAAIREPTGPKPGSGEASPVDAGIPSRKPPARRARSTSGSTSSRTNERESDVTDNEMQDDLSLAEQGVIATAFVRGVLDRFGAASATVSTQELDEDTVEVRVEGEDLGLLIGPKGAALQSLQELTRTVVQRQMAGRAGRVLVDVSGYRAKRREALERFAGKIAEDVLASGNKVVLEPMGPADRKVIHDALSGIEGVSTSSEGEEPRRRIVVTPA